MSIDIVDEYLDKKEQEAASHGLYSLLAALGQDYTAGANMVIPGDEGKNLYKRNSELHAGGKPNDNIDDGQLSHESAKFLVDTLLTYPLATAVAAGVNMMNLADPKATAIYKFGGNAAVNAGLSAAKTKAAGKEYTLGDLGNDIVASLGSEVAGALRTMPRLTEYVGGGVSTKGLAHLGKAAKATAKEVLNDYQDDDESALNNYDNLYVYRNVRE